jgi:hypothetical protein
LTLKNPGRSVSTNYTQLILILVDPVDDEDWRDRPRTDPSSISDLGTGWIQLNFCVETPFSSVILSFSSINWSRLLS